MRTDPKAFTGLATRFETIDEARGINLRPGYVAPIEDAPDLYAVMSAAERASVSFGVILVGALTPEEREAALRLFREMDEIMADLPFRPTA